MHFCRSNLCSQKKLHGSHNVYFVLQCYNTRAFIKQGLTGIILIIVSMKILFMEKRILGICLSVLGIIGLIYAGLHFVNGASGAKSVKSILFSGILGALFFFAGISLVRNTSDKPT
jgi:hypothetical protein